MTQGDLNSEQCSDQIVTPRKHVVEPLIATLTPKQYLIFGLLGDGLSNKAIARATGITESTVKSHVTVILVKLGCANRTLAALHSLWHRQGNRRAG